MRRSLLLIVALLALAPAAAQAASPPPGFFGVMADGVLMTRDDASFAHEFQVMKATGVESVRPVVYWADMQPQRDGPILFGSLDRLMGEAARNGISVLPVVLRAPDWAREHPNDIGSHPKHPADYAAFFTALIGRYGPNGTFWAEHPDIPARPQRTWEVWNEPNLQRYWSPSIVTGRASARAFVRLTEVASAAIRKADPGARVILSSFGEAGPQNTSWDAIKLVFRAGLKASAFDAVAGHPFSGRVANVLKIVRFERAEFARHGAARKPMIISELSWPSAKGRTNNFTTGFETTEKGQAAKLRQAYTQLLKVRSRYRIESVFWSTWLTTDCCSSNNFDWSGLRKVNRRNPGAEPISKPALRAFRALARR
ncbi:glycoside hydrolase 5 family protein [Capillimicrobium parvum]|uniref:Glycoside hydrolase family 5 domain-containing protein n=1 Tax=Capillimicrobium parvum TaxID=2884022 RepID=A0A9E6XZK0_9ACTN|nr:hypothetical protein [Capillimicrobium parvum]UGS37427.1 hypothetical protein DSM104329_03843 [Capillimicrobium parvum]